MGQTWSTFLVPGLPSCSGGSWSMLVAARSGDQQHLIKACSQEPLLLLACTLKGFSLAHMAADSGNAATLQLLIKLVSRYAGQLARRLQEVLSWSSSGADILKAARSSASDEQVARLLNPDLLLQTLLSWQDIRGVTPLMLASRGGHVDCLRLLLQHGADPLLLDSVNRRSCLHYAAGAGHTRCINMLLNQFVTVLQPVAQAAAEQQPQLQRQQQQLVLLSEAVVQDSYRGTTSFVDLRTRTGFSALHYATFWGFIGCVHALLTAGASIDQPMLNPSRQHSELPVVNGCTALHLAADCGHTAIAALLLHAHVVRMAKSSPRPPGNQPQQEWLPWEGAAHQDPRVRRNVSGDTPLTLAENRCNSKEVLRTLLDPCVPINRTLPGLLTACFGGPPRFGVPQLAALAKAALDQHLTGSLNQLEQQQQEQMQQMQLAMQHDSDARRLSRTPTLEDLVGVDEQKGGLDDIATQLQEADIFGPSSNCSISSSPTASRSTSCGSISSLASSSSYGTVGTQSSSEVSSVTGCSPCSSSGTSSQLPYLSSSTSGFSVTAVTGLHSRAISVDSTIAESIVTSSTDHTCAICFDANANVMMAGCCHCVCSRCARSLLVRTSVNKPALCPFCRAGLSGFVAAPVSCCAASR